MTKDSRIFNCFLLDSSATSQNDKLEGRGNKSDDMFAETDSCMFQVMACAKGRKEDKFIQNIDWPDYTSERIIEEYEKTYGTKPQPQ